METTVSVLGIILSIIFGVYSIWAYQKAKTTIGILFKFENCYSLFRDDVGRLNMELSYNKIPLLSPILLLKAKLINNGKGDVDKSKIYKPLKIISGNDYKWLEFRITSKSADINCTSNIINNTEVQIEWDLFKSGEYIEIEALIELKNTKDETEPRIKNFFDSLTFDFRISNLKTIRKELLEGYLLFQRNRQMIRYIEKLFNTIFPFFYFLLIILFIGTFIPQFKNIFNEPPRVVKYIFDNGTSKEIGLVKYERNPDYLILELDNPQRSSKLKIDDFNSKYKIVGIEKYNINWLQLLPLQILFGGLLIFLLFYQKWFKKITAFLKKI